jgi:hypothetical protein
LGGLGVGVRGIYSLILLSVIYQQTKLSNKLDVMDWGGATKAEMALCAIYV